jgi:GTPase SAR1 family protein
VTTSFFNSADGVIIAYSVTHAKTFDSVSRWMEMVRDKSDAPIAIVATKADLPAAIDLAAAAEFCASQKEPISHTVTSAMDGRGVEEAFDNFIDRMSQARKPRSQSTVKLDKSSPAMPPPPSCC